ncbi:MAG: PQQ-binding-like beta-propeller repeat protein [Sulfitobacter sp.]
MTAISQKPIAGQMPKMLGVALAGALVLSACTENEAILPGVREGIRSVLENPGSDPADAGVPENQSRAIALGAAQANANWAQSPGSPQFRTAHPALSAAPQPIWSASIGAGDSRRHRITAAPVVDAGRVFTLDAQSQVTATSTAGATLWSRDIKPVSDDDTRATGGGIAVANGTVYVSLGYGSLVALDAESGAEKWRQQLDATGSGTPTVLGDLVYVTAGDNTGWAVNTSNGRVAWQIGASTDINNVLGAPAPAVANDLVLFGFGSGELQAVFRRGGLRRWDASVLGQRPGRALSNVGDITGAPMISGDTVYVGNQSGRILALKLGSGERIWTAREGASGPVWPAGDSVFAISDTNELLRLDASDGSRIWGVPLPNFVKERPRKRSEVVANYGPIVAGGRVIVASNDGVIRSFDPTDGTLTNTVQLPGGATTAPVVAGGTLYVVSSKGQLHAFR